MAASNSPTWWLHRYQDHTAAVKALAWCPSQSNLLASGGGAGDRSIKFWKTHTGACLNSVDTGSQVCALSWNKNERELLSSHGFSNHQLTPWKYPSMGKIAELTGHTSRVLYMTQSPDGCTVATAAGDETLRFWNVFGSPEKAAKPAPRAKPEPFAHSWSWMKCIFFFYSVLASFEEDILTACLRPGALMAVLSYLDFFSTGVQRVALSTAANMCKKLPSDAADFVMEAVPLLLQYHDSKVLEHASVCLTRIAEAFASSPEQLYELCNHGLVEQAASLISMRWPSIS